MNENINVNAARNPYLNLRPTPAPIIPFFKPDGVFAGMVANNLDFQMRHSIEALEAELAEAGEARVIQLALLGGKPRYSESWELYVDGVLVASGSTEFARECFCESGTRFLDVCRRAVAANAAVAFSSREHELLKAVQGIARAEARMLAARGEC